MFITTLFVQALVATAAFALPSGRERLDKRVAMRNGGLRQGVPRQIVEKNLATNVSHVEYSSNWAGAVLNSAKVRSFRCSFYLCG